MSEEFREWQTEKIKVLDSLVDGRGVQMPDDVGAAAVTAAATITSQLDGFEHSANATKFLIVMFKNVYSAGFNSGAESMKIALGAGSE